MTGWLVLGSERRRSSALLIFYTSVLPGKRRPCCSLIIIEDGDIISTDCTADLRTLQLPDTILLQRRPLTGIRTDLWRAILLLLPCGFGDEQLWSSSLCADAEDVKRSVLTDKSFAVLEFRELGYAGKMTACPVNRLFENGGTRRFAGARQHH